MSQSLSHPRQVPKSMFADILAYLQGIEGVAREVFTGRVKVFSLKLMDSLAS